MDAQSVIDELREKILRSKRESIVNNVMVVFLRLLLTHGPDVVRELFSRLDRSELSQVSLSASTALRYLAYEVATHHVELATELRRTTELSTVTAEQIHRACRDLFSDQVVTWLPARRRTSRKKSA